MGGLAGHMSHLYSDPNLKLSEVIKLISGIMTGDIQINEKADGQNIYVTMTPDRQVLFARNQGDKNAGGITLNQLINRFIENAKKKGFYVEGELLPTQIIFTDGCRAITQVLQSLSNETFLKVFNDPNMPETFINTEIIHAKQPNLVLYKKYHIQFHEFEVMGDSPYDTIEGLNLLNEKFDDFLSEVSKQEITIPSIVGGSINFSIDGPQFLPNRSDALSSQDFDLFKQETESAITLLNQLFNDSGLTPENTIGDYFIAKLEDEVLPELGVPDQIISDISHFLVYNTDSSGVLVKGQRATLNAFKKKLISVMGKEMTDKFTLGKNASFQNGLVGICLSPIKEIIHKYSLSILNTADSVIAADPGLARFAAKKALSDISSLRRALEAEYADAPDKLERYLIKFDRELSLLGNIEDFAQSMEGVVITYIRDDGMPMLYKLTGNFAPANQILGASSQGFEIKRSLLDAAEAEYASLQPEMQVDLNNMRRKKSARTIPDSPTDILGNPDDSDDLMERRIRKMIRESISRNYLNLMIRNKRY